jgi:hypothetical protein
MQTGRFGLLPVGSANVATWWKAERPKLVGSCRQAGRGFTANAISSNDATRSKPTTPPFTKSDTGALLVIGTIAARKTAASAIPGLATVFINQLLRCATSMQSTRS